VGPPAYSVYRVTVNIQWQTGEEKRANKQPHQYVATAFINK
jgi:hypothetical protein